MSRYGIETKVLRMKIYMWNLKDDITGWNLDKTRPKKTSCDLCKNGKCTMSSLLHCDNRKDGKCLLVNESK